MCVVLSVCVCVCVLFVCAAPISLFCGTYDMATEKPRIYEDGAVIHESESEFELFRHTHSEEPMDVDVVHATKSMDEQLDQIQSNVEKLATQLDKVSKQMRPPTQTPRPPPRTPGGPPRTVTTGRYAEGQRASLAPAARLNPPVPFQGRTLAVRRRRITRPHSRSATGRPSRELAARQLGHSDP